MSFSGPYKFKVTFTSTVKVGKALKTFTNVELHRTEANYKLRAAALNWTIVNVEAI